MPRSVGSGGVTCGGRPAFGEPLVDVPIQDAGRSARSRPRFGDRRAQPGVRRRVNDRRPTIGVVDIEGSLAEIVVAASRWISDAGEVLAIARYSRAAGARGYPPFRRFRGVCGLGKLATRRHQSSHPEGLPARRRGAASDVRHRIPNETDVEWLMIVEGGGYQGRIESWECSGTSEVLLRLEDYDREQVAIGRMPAWNPAVDPHAPDTLSAIVPRADGTTQRGVY